MQKLFCCGLMAIGRQLKKSDKIFMKKSLKGFTIIELIVVIAIIAILAAIVMVNVVQYINKAKNAKILSDIDAYVKAAQLYKVEYDGYPKVPTGGWACLGEGYTGGVCYNGTEESTVNNDFKEFLPSLPHETVTGNLGTSILDTYYYSGGGCNDSNCKTASFMWVLHGDKQSCGVGTKYIDEGFGVTICYYDLNQ